MTHYRKSKLNHARVEYYRVTHNPGHNNFLIRPDYLFENALKFVYEKNGETIEKIISVPYIGPYLKKKMFWEYDEALLKKVFHGVAYSVPEQIIFNY